MNDTRVAERQAELEAAHAAWMKNSQRQYRLALFAFFIACLVLGFVLTTLALR